MGKRRHSVRRHKRAKTRTSSKRGGENTPTDGRLATFYNPETGEPTKSNVPFFNPNKFSDKTQNMSKRVINNSNISDNLVYEFPAEYLNSQNISISNAAASRGKELNIKRQHEGTNIDNKLAEYRQIRDNENIKCDDSAEPGCNIMGGLKRRKTSRRKTSRRKTFKRKSHRYK
jgi:hypothetical protein